MTANNSFALPAFTEERIFLLEKLSNACGVSGNEREIRILIKKEIGELADSLNTDALGNLIAVKKAKISHPLKILVAAHMDEVGFFLINDDKDQPGIFQFTIVGGIDPRVIAGKPVWVGKEHVPGVIGACPVHLTTKEQRKKVLEIEDLRIDVGPGEKRVQIGDFAAFATKFIQMGTSLCGKAIDDRIGVETLIDLFKHAPDSIELTAVFTVQEEIGARGAISAAYDIKPDMAFVLDSTPAMDLPTWDGSENSLYKSKLGKGPAIYAMDSGMVSDPRLIRYLLKEADRYSIPVQMREPLRGGTDAMSIHLTQGGIPTVSISIPARYPHTAASICRICDWKSTYQLMSAALHDADTSILERN